MPRNLLLIVITIIIGMLIYAVIMNNNSAQNKPPEKHKPITKHHSPAPDFTFKTLDNKELTLYQFKGKIILIHFWASWCAPCIVELPKLVKLAKDYPDDIIILALSNDINEQKLLQFLTKQNLMSPPKNLKFIWDQDKAITQDLFQTIKLPETIITDRDTRMIRKIAGDAAWQSPEMQTYLKEIITKK